MNKKIKNEELEVAKETTLSYFIRVLVFLSGTFVLATGAATVITAGLGAPTWDVLHIGLANITGLSIGRWVQIVGIIMVLMTCILEKERISIGSVVNILLIGYFLNFVLGLNILPVFTGMIQKFILLIIGVVLMGLGSGMYVASNIGAGPRDGMTLYISKRFSISIRLSRTILEVMALTIGWLIGGPVSFGTFVTIPLIGPVMQASLRFWMKILLKLPKRAI